VKTKLDGGRREWTAVLKGMPRPKGSAPRAPKGSVQDALESLEARRKRKPVAAPMTKGKRDDLDLDSIP
jgi:hypothetical protein